MRNDSDRGLNFALKVSSSPKSNFLGNEHRLAQMRHLYSTRHWVSIK